MVGIKTPNLVIKMRDRIKGLIEDLESEYDIKILFAVESGSRLWRMASKDSDYDVRFVFVQRKHHYLSLNAKGAMERVINRTYEDKLIDVCGFDIFKFCQLLAKSNPSVIEWLQSDIVYYGEKPNYLLEIGLTGFNPVALYYHYRSMCKSHYDKYISQERPMTLKQYLYALRGLVNAKWIEGTGKLPDISFPDQLKEMYQFLGSSTVDEICDIIEKKKKGNDKEVTEKLPFFDVRIEGFLAHQNTEMTKGRSPSQKKINTALRRALKVWEVDDAN